jgi:CHASE2 domain-containing sensor protein
LLRDIFGASGASRGLPASKHSEVSGKIVLLGGTYDPQDRHQTALGLQDGVELVASAVESELNPQSSKELGLVWEILIDIVITLLVVGLSYFLRPHWAMAGALALVAVLFLFGPLFAIVAGYRTSAISFSLGVLLEQMAHGADAREELHLARLELKDLKRGVPLS